MDPALEKLRAALEEYLAAGGDTPVAPEAQALMDAIGTMGGDQGADAGMEPGLDELGGAPDPTASNAYQPDGADMPPVEEAPLPEDMPPPQPNAKTFEGARAGAKDRLKKLNRR